MAHWFGTESLLILCAIMMAATVVLLERVTHARTQGKSSPEFFHPPEGQKQPATRRALFQQVWESRHLTMMVLLLSVAVIVEAFIDYEYKVVARHSIVSKDHLTAFFGSVTFYIGVFSLLFQMLFSNRILKRFGVGTAILLLPAGLLAAFAAMSVKPVLWAAALLQLIDGGFS